MGPEDEIVLLDLTGPRIVILGYDGHYRGSVKIRPTPGERVSLAVDRRGSILLVEASGKLHFVNLQGEALGRGIAVDSLPENPGRAVVSGDGVLFLAVPRQGTIRRWQVHPTGPEDGNE